MSKLNESMTKLLRAEGADTMRGLIAEAGLIPEAGLIAKLAVAIIATN